MPQGKVVILCPNFNQFSNSESINRKRVWFQWRDLQCHGACV